MTQLASRGGLVGVTLAAAVFCAVPANAAITPIRPQGLNDISGDGRYALLSDGTVLDRTDGRALLGQAPMVSVDIANDAPIALGQNGSALYVRTAATPRGTLVSVGPDGVAVPAASSNAKLIRGGHAVVFSTTESPSRILVRDLDTNTTTELVARAALLDASEDGKLVTWLRPIRPAARTAGTALASDPGAWVNGQAVGYTLNGTTSRIVAKSSWTQRIVGDAPASGCPATTELDQTAPTNLSISQNGSGQYALLLATSYQRGGGFPFAAGSYGHLTATGTLQEASDNGETTTTITQVDPVSGAWTSILNDKTNGFPSMNRVQLHEPSGQTVSLLNVGQAGTTDPVGRYTNAVPISGGAAVAYTLLPSDGTGGGAYVRDGFTPGTDATPWLTLPRAIDAANDAAATGSVAYVVCAATSAPVAGVFADYASIVPAAVGNSAGTVTLKAAPANKLPLASAKIAVSWRGMQTWSRTATAPGAVALPSIPVGVAGFKVTVTVKLADGTTLTSSAALRRTR